MKTYNIVIASDHSGYLLKETIIQYLHDKKLSVKDFGTYSQDTVDYPDYAANLANGVLEGIAPLGILICGTGIGMSIAANRRSGIRAALCTDLFMAERARSHNDSNVLVLGAKIVDESLAMKIVDKFLSTKFEGGRHSARLAKLV